MHGHDHAADHVHDHGNGHVLERWPSPPDPATELLADQGRLCTPAVAPAARLGRELTVTILVVALARDPHRQSEALRAALGLTLRGARVEVLTAEPLATPLAHRAAETLRAFGYPVGAAEGDALASALARADRVEVWT